MTFRFVALFGFCFLLMSAPAGAQSVPVYTPKVEPPIDFTYATPEQWERLMRMNYERMTRRQRVLYDSAESLRGPFTEAAGCSWYCGGGPDSVYSSAAAGLHQPPKSGKAAVHAHDFSLLQSWQAQAASGQLFAPDEELVFRFPAQSPRVDEIKIWNGNHRTSELWQASTRVKTLELSYDGTPVAVLALEDVRGMQSYKLGPFPREISPQTFRLSFKITSVYPGTAGTPAEFAEINFDGLDVHCFGPETPISLANGTSKRIDRIVPGDTVQTFNFRTGQLEPARVNRLVAAVHAHLLRLHFEDRTVVATDDHPFWTESGAWASCNPFKSNTLYVQGTPVRALTPGDRIFLPEENRYVEWCGAEQLNGAQTTYTLELENGQSFLANDLLVQTEAVLGNWIF
jgi:hypothetical protein